MLVGNLGRDPELRHTQSGQPVANLSVATSESYVDKQGNKQTRTEWHRVVVWGKTAENTAKYLNKGRQVHIEGRLVTRSFKDKDGKDRTVTEIHSSQVTFLGAVGKGNETKSSQEDVELQEALDGDVPF
jgi:single-strand DNA-binding protein